MGRQRIIEAIRVRDPDWYALHRAIRAGIVVPAVFAIGAQLVGDSQVATFAAFGCFAQLLLVDFPGNATGRLAGYLLLALAGVVLITVGTLVSRPEWLAVVGMAVVAFGVLFAGVISSATAAAGRAALLAFTLPVMLPGGVSDIPPRLAGWGLAVAFAVPAAMLIWPPRAHHELRERTAQMSRALAALLAPPAAAGGLPAGEEARTEARTATIALRKAFRGTTFRPVGLTTGSRMLVRLVDELEWLHGVVARAHLADSPPASPLVADMCAAAADVLLACSCELSREDSTHVHSCPDLDERMDRLAERRRAVADHPLGAPVWAHQIGYLTWLIGQSVATIAAADARPLLARLAGRRPVAPLLGALSTAERRAAGHLDRHSVWLHNSLRGAAGLAAAVLIAEVVGVQHGFWVVLGAMSVLRSNALSTGSTVLRAMAGTVVGFAIGGLLVQAIGTNPNVLWPLLPVAVFVAGFAPDAVSFAAGQAAFTVVVIILFNIIVPEGWKVGLLRVEDVALGCAASLAVGLLFWPRGAGVALRYTLADGYRVAASYLVAAAGYTARAAPQPMAEHARTKASALRLDDAFRQYLAERGAKPVPLATVTLLANGFGQLHFVADAVATLRPRGDGAGSVPSGLRGQSRQLVDEARRLQTWYDRLADVLGDPARQIPGVGAPYPHRTRADDTARRLVAVDGAADTAAARADEATARADEAAAARADVVPTLTPPLALTRPTLTPPLLLTPMPMPLVPTSLTRLFLFALPSRHCRSWRARTTPRRPMRGRSSGPTNTSTTSASSERDSSNPSPRSPNSRPDRGGR